MDTVAFIGDVFIFPFTLLEIVNFHLIVKLEESYLTRPIK